MTTHTATLADFLLARIAEDEAFWDAVEESKQAHPDRIRRYRTECEVKRRIVEQATAVATCSGHDPAFYEEFERDYGIPADRHLPERYAPGCDGCAAAASVAAQDAIYLALLALPYADREDYREEWRP